MWRGARVCSLRVDASLGTGCGVEALLSNGEQVVRVKGFDISRHLRDPVLQRSLAAAHHIMDLRTFACMAGSDCLQNCQQVSVLPSHYSKDQVLVDVVKRGVLLASWLIDEVPRKDSRVCAIPAKKTKSALPLFHHTCLHTCHHTMPLTEWIDESVRGGCTMW